jgi:hypothetical protein
MSIPLVIISLGSLLLEKEVATIVSYSCFLQHNPSSTPKLRTFPRTRPNPSGYPFFSLSEPRKGYP